MSMPQTLMPKKLKLNGSMMTSKPSKTNTHTQKKTCPFQQRKLEGKSMKPRDIWNNSQVWPWSTK